MRITRVEPIVLRLPEVDVTRADGTQDAFLVRIHTDEGITGIGEADTSPYLARTAIEMPSSHAISRGLAELLVGEDPLQVERMWRRLYDGSSYYGRSALALHAISAIDMALWDIGGRAAGKPVSELLGGRKTEQVRVYASEVMPETVDEVRAIGERAVAAGYRALKLGWGPLGRSLDRDEELVRAAREAIGPERDLMLDGGQAYTVESAKALLERIADVRLYWLEEPLAPDDYEGYARLAGSGTRTAAGEADTTFEPFRRLVQLGRVDVLQPDVARCGGFTVARRILELAARHDVEVVPHCFSTGVLVTASLHVAAASARPTYSEFSVADSPLAGGLLASAFSLEDGTLAVPTGPGLGIELDEDAVGRLRLS